MKTKAYMKKTWMRTAMTLFVMLFAYVSAWAQYVAIYADPYSAGMVQVGTEIDLSPFSDGASFTVADPGETVYFSFEPNTDYRFKGIRYTNLSSDDVTELPNGIYSFTMPEYTDDEFWVSIFIEFEKIPVVVTGIDINEDNFPDENFRKWLLSQSYGQDAVITDAEMAGITKITALACGIEDLTGIGYFTELTELNLSNFVGTHPEEDWNKIVTADFSGNTKLRKVWMSNNQLVSLNITQNTDLRVIDVSNNALEQLNVTKNDKLQYLTCNDNQIAELDVKSNSNLALLSCSGNQLADLDVTENQYLEQLYCENNQLTTIDVTNHEKLMVFNCNDNKLISLDVTGCPELYQLYCYNNQIKGQAMDNLVNSLPEFPYAYMVVLDLLSEIEENAITDEQVAVARGKGWSVEGIRGENFVPLGNSETHEYVDLGLTSGTKWATCNVGASKPQDIGDYFAWGETTGHGNDVLDGYWFDWAHYKWSECIGEDTYFTKYCSDSSRGKDGFTDGKFELDPEDDAAYVNWGSQWRTPTQEQLKELKEECEWTWTSLGDVYGYEVKGRNNNTIFLPDTGWRIDDILLEGGAYWSRTGKPDDVGGAFFLGFYGTEWYTFGGRMDGQCVRPVAYTNTYIKLADDGENSEIIATAAASEDIYDVKLDGRTLYKDGYWNTLCLPFSMTAEQLTASPLAGAEIRTLATASVTGHHVDMAFGSNESSITAGTPYIVRWDDNTNSTIIDPVFRGVTISNEKNDYILDDGHVKFIGYYDAFTVSPNDDQLVYYLTAGNTLKYTATERTLKACRAYFTFTANDGGNINTFDIDFGDGHNSIQNVGRAIDKEDDAWFDLSGRRLKGIPTQKGVYVTRGQKVIIK